MEVVLFEDARVAQLAPIALGRPAFAISCGSNRLVDQVAALGHSVSAVVRPHLEAITRADFSELGGAKTDAADGPRLFVNARMVPSVGTRRELARLVKAGTAGIVHSGESVAAALLADGSTQPKGMLDAEQMAAGLDALGLPELKADLPLLEYPHDVVRYHLVTMKANLEARVAEGDYREIADGVLASGEVTVDASVVVDSRHGPVVLEAGAEIRPHCFLQGPVYVGERARINEHASIKECVALGTATKVGGEVEASVIESFSNKQHYGFLGHSYLGSWINLGAGTCNSDLKNTYGEVTVQHGGEKVPTRMQFLGATVGDYTKTAINTSIFTGKTIGVGSMLYGFVTGNVPSFVNYASQFGQVTAVPIEVMVTTQARVFARRNIPQRPCDIQLLRDIYEMTKDERAGMSTAPLSW